MNVLIYGACNSISISVARYLYISGHHAILADTTRFARAFYSKYCRNKYVFKEPLYNREGFSSDLFNCIRREDVELVLPTSDKAMFSLASADRDVFKDVKVTFPIDIELIRYVADKKNIPAICSQAGIASIPTYVIDRNFRISEVEQVPPPYARKLSRGISGEGFKILSNLQEAEREINSVNAKGMAGKYLIQKYIEGAVYGAVGVYEDNVFRSFHSYRYIRRYPEPAGNPTICAVDYQDGVRDAMNRVLKCLRWKGFCQMDFVFDEKTKGPYLIDINPVHWYSVPNSFSKEFSCLSCYLDESRNNQPERSISAVHYTTIGLLRELQRVLSFWKHGEKDFSLARNYWNHLSKLKASDFYWDPLPVVLAPFLKLLHRTANDNI